MTKKLLLFVLLFCSFILSASAQDNKLNQRRVKPSQPPGGIKLLDGYVHIQEQGYDTWVGRIKKEGGLNIKYDIGRLAGEYVNQCVRENTCAWYKEQQLKGGLVKIALTEDGRIYRYVPENNSELYCRSKIARGHCRLSDNDSDL